MVGFGGDKKLCLSMVCFGGDNKVHALVNFLLILAHNDLMHLGIWTCDGKQPNWAL